MKKQPFFQLPDGSTAHLYTLDNGNGMIAEISDFGGILHRLFVPDRNGDPVDVVLGYRDGADYLVNAPHLGGTIGRYGNRIGGAAFELDGKCYPLFANEGANTLHGGLCYCRRMWQMAAYTDTRLELALTSPDGDAGFPGKLEIRAVFEVTPENVLHLEYHAVTDAPTVVNMTNHSYFNLAGEAAGSLADQRIAIFADRVQAVDANLIPTGELRPVDGSFYDLRQGRDFRDIFAERDSGFDDNFIIAPACDGTIRTAATVISRRSGIRLDVRGDDPAVQLYTSGMLDEKTAAKNGPFNRVSAFCLEMQGYIDAPNHPEYPSQRLDPGKTYRRTIEFAFSTDAGLGD
ncbi:MAG: galactose mutarotase [Lentisphaeria bacterium]|nr:galactose mutarotase [Lentisphaeria bacterium]